MLFKISEKIKPLLVDRTARWMLLSAGILNLATWVLLLARLAPFIARGRIIALHYNIYSNVNAVGSAGWALSSAAIGLVILVLNSAFAARSYGERRQNAIVILVVTCFYEFLTLLAAFFILLINTQR